MCCREFVQIDGTPPSNEIPFEDRKRNHRLCRIGVYISIFACLHQSFTELIIGTTLLKVGFLLSSGWFLLGKSHIQLSNQGHSRFYTSLCDNYIYYVSWEGHFSEIVKIDYSHAVYYDYELWRGLSRQESTSRTVYFCFANGRVLSLEWSEPVENMVRVLNKWRNRQLK